MHRADIDLDQLHMDKSTEILPLFWKSLFLSDLLCSIDRYSLENTLGRNCFATHAYDTGESGHYLGTPMKKADLIDSSSV